MIKHEEQLTNFHQKKPAHKMTKNNVAVSSVVILCLFQSGGPRGSIFS